MGREEKGGKDDESMKRPVMTTKLLPVTFFVFCFSLLGCLFSFLHVHVCHLLAASVKLTNLLPPSTILKHLTPALLKTLVRDFKYPMCYRDND